MISAKVDFLQLLVVKATVGRLAVGEPCKVDNVLSCTTISCAVLVQPNSLSHYIAPL